MPTDQNNLTVLKPKDFASDQDVRWCPGCGDYAILNQVRKVAASLGARRENTVFVSGIGCSSRFPYYMNTYGFHSIHGRAPGFATGIKIANPDLDVWMVTGDGDGLSIGGNHLMHVLRRNVNVNIMLFNNRIYGLTKGQYSPTSEVGKKTKSSPMGSLDMPINPISIALAAEASFVARSVDIDKDLPKVLERAATDKDTKEDSIVRLEHGKPMIFGKNRDKGIRMHGTKLEVVELGKGVSEDDLLFHDETDEGLAYLLARMRHPAFPEPMGVFHVTEDACYEDLLAQQVADAVAARGQGTLEQLFNSGDAYTIEDGQPAHGLHE